MEFEGVINHPADKNRCDTEGLIRTRNRLTGSGAIGAVAGGSTPPEPVFKSV